LPQLEHSTAELGAQRVEPLGAAFVQRVERLGVAAQPFHAGLSDGRVPAVGGDDARQLAGDAGEARRGIDGPRHVRRLRGGDVPQPCTITCDTDRVVDHVLDQLFDVLQQVGDQRRGRAGDVGRRSEEVRHAGLTRVTGSGRRRHQPTP